MQRKKKEQHFYETLFYHKNTEPLSTKTRLNASNITWKIVEINNKKKKIEVQLQPQQKQKLKKNKFVMETITLVNLVKIVSLVMYMICMVCDMVLAAAAISNGEYKF